ncbi:putative proline-rich receptor-like protein kinase PERK3 [Iris pallida]|uniref:Proline-rich receptor-like protein kinase PERK3 n=2 Tax=Iris pallida TaxID=29817 RepID=A0AAX6IHQ2_IRIPA|nr:putative proline-rich receptor-like protein kinase PERK3 [Iris pallida]
MEGGQKGGMRFEAAWVIEEDGGRWHLVGGLLESGMGRAWRRSGGWSRADLRYSRQLG